MKRGNRSSLGNIGDKLTEIKEWILEHSRIVMPCVLILCVAITVIIAVNANKREALEKKAAEAAALAATNDVSAESNSNSLDAPLYELEENAHPELNTFIKNYYDAMAKGDVLTVASMNTNLNDVEKIKIKEQSKYIEPFQDLMIYTKPGLTDNSYVAYVTSKTKFKDLETPLPGLQTYYIESTENGDFRIYNTTSDDDPVYEYVSSLVLQDDYIDLQNKITVEYNDILAENTEVNEFVAYFTEKMKEEIGEALASIESPVTEEETDNTATEGDDAKAAVVVTKVKATDVVNIRKSDSEKADKIDKAQIGQEFNLIEEKGNGWSEIEYNGGSAFIKSEFLEAVQTVTIGNEDENEGEEEVGEAKPDAPAATSSSTNVKGKVKINDSGVRVRKEPSTEADIIVTLYTGDRLDLIESMTSGWSKVKYNGEYGYVKSEFLDEE
ncbi:MAG: SH3 domain-containing protein [Lachnospiraceae bacterium]|nr:SH3 domain-containing protein [Lachnospiraceae bacterium]